MVPLSEMESTAELVFEDYTVAWIAPLEIEAQAAWYTLDKIHEGSFSTSRGDDYLYGAGEINGHNVVIATFPAGHVYGVGSAAALAAQVKKSFPNLWFGLLVGVAAGLPDLSRDPPRDIRLGDVLVGVGEGESAGLVSYGLGKETPYGFEILQHGIQAQTETIVRSAIGQIKCLTPMRGNFFLEHYYDMEDKEHASGTFRDPGQEKDQLYHTVNEGIDLVPRLVERTPRHASQRTQVWYGTIGSGDKLMRNSRLRDDLRDKFNLIGLEMEAAGTMNTIPVGIIRGVCDYGDAHKNKEWQPFAAAMAAAYSKALLYQIGPPRNRRKERQNIKQAQKRDCLLSLSFPNIDNRRHNIVSAHQGTCNWLFDTAQFQMWQRRDGFMQYRGVLWIKGKPGAGKSTLMKHILLHSERLFQDYIVAAYFFNARGDQLEKTPMGMLRSLLYQLVDKDPLLCERFVPLFLDKQKKHEAEWEWQAEELKSFLLSEIRVCQSRPLLILVDALDECNEPEVRQVVSFLESLSINAISVETRLSICLSSRHYPNISIERSLELVVEQQYGHSEDIVGYVQHKLRIRDVDIEYELLQKAANVFMWVVLVVEMLNQAFDNGRVRAMKKKLREVPSDLDEVFWTLLEKDNLEKEETILMLQWVLFASRLLTPAELYFAVLAGTDVEELGVWDRSKDTEEVIERYITSTSKGLIEVRRGYSRTGTTTVQFIHESVNDFLLRNKRLQMLDPSLEPHILGASHNRLAACCLSYIMMEEFEPLVSCSLSDLKLKLGGQDNKTIQFDFNPPNLKYPFLGYASTSLLYHAEKAQAGNITQQALVERLQQSCGDFDRLRRFYNIFHKSSPERMGFAEGLYALSDRTYYAEGENLLYALSLHGYRELVRIVLLNKKTEVNMQQSIFGTAIIIASYQRHKEVVSLLLEQGADPNIHCDEFGSAMQVAVERGDPELVELLVKNGADIDVQCGGYGSPLTTALIKQCYPKIDRTMIENYQAIWDFLLKKGANPNARSDICGTALHMAVESAHSVLVEQLIENGADVNIQCEGRDNLLMTALSRQPDPQVNGKTFENYQTVVKLLVEKGADPNARNDNNDTALQIASAKGNQELVELLLERGADINAQGGRYGSAFQAASVRKHPHIVRLLAEHYADMWLGGIGRLELKGKLRHGFSEWIEPQLRQMYLSQV